VPHMPGAKILPRKDSTPKYEHALVPYRFSKMNIAIAVSQIRWRRLKNVTYSIKY